MTRAIVLVAGLAAVALVPLSVVVLTFASRLQGMTP